MKRWRFLHALLALILNCPPTSQLDSNGIVEDHDYWFSLGKEDIAEVLKHKVNEGKAKNVILFIGDGMGLSTTTAARIYGKSERDYMVYEKFPNIAGLKTYSANKIVPDSCSTATALFCGVKANQKTAGVDASVDLDDCAASLKPEARLESIVDWAQASGKRTGLVTTTRVTHATPSALYAHTANRKWECEAAMPENATGCKDIARQLIEDEPGKNINVIMGGGRQCMQSHAIGDDGDPIDTWSCYSLDGRDLIADWIADKESRDLSHAFVSNNEQLANVPEDADHVLGVFANGHLKLEHARDRGPLGMPSLADMTEAAIKLLRDKDDGYVLMVEGGMIDMAHHRGHAKQALSETIAFEAAIAATVALTADQSDETLIIVTSDHSHPMVISGYADRTTAITGIAQNSKMDNVPYTTLLYGLGGPDNYKYSVVDGKVAREDPSTVDTDDFNYAQQAAVLTDEVAHDGTDVLVYAKGPMSHLFQSVHEQTYVANVIAYAAKIGPFKNGAAPQISGCLALILLKILIDTFTQTTSLS